MVVFPCAYYAPLAESFLLWLSCFLAVPAPDPPYAPLLSPSSSSYSTVVGHTFAFTVMSKGFPTGGAP